ncbi:MAG: hypothetical protein K6E73_04770 [Bacteroidales bacterium]|nr:hypothetical protein [Bacteroidales bacterium]
MNKLLYLGVAAMLLAGCGNLEDEDYYSSNTVRNENSDILSTDLSVVDYIQSRSDLSKMSELFQQQGIYEQMPTSGELHTVLVVTNDNYSAPEADEAEKVAKSHVTNISVSPSKLNNGDRLLMWHDKYVTITLDEEALSGSVIGHILFNSSTLEQVVKAQDGFIYVISDMIVTPTSLQDYINGLDDTKYSRFKQLVLSSGGQEFDKANSKAIGVDVNGNTIYDSVFIYTNTFFDAKSFDLSSEALKATMLVFSNDVIEKALDEAKAKLKSWGYDHKMQLLRNGSLDSVYVGYTSDEDLEKWILEVAFFKKTYSVEDLKSEDNVSIKSIYDRIWRNDIQTLDLDNPVSLSNGVAYEVKDFRIPNNRLIYRLHEEFNSYAKCNTEQAGLYFKTKNMTSPKVSSNEVAPWTPLSGVWEAHGNSPLTYKVEDNTVAHFEFDYTPIFVRDNGEGGYDVRVLMVPPGTYRMAMGFKQNMTAMSVQLIAVDEAGDQFECADAVALALSDGSTAYHYDRGATLSNRLPEYYDVTDSRFDESLKSKFGYYWTDGGPVYTEVEVPAVNGEGKAVQLLIHMTSENGTSAGTLTFNHWCLRPTENNY